VYLDVEQAATWQQAMAEQAEFRYIRPADPREVMREQLDYLLDHAPAITPRCPDYCPDCRRLALVESLLLVPFAPTPR
jgi:hypothetical protein